jgi:hypothetical protein
MAVHPLMMRVLTDDALTRGLGDEEARLLVEWLVERAESLSEELEPDDAERELTRLKRRARSWSRFVSLWSEPRSRGAAIQLAGVERYTWPLPEGPLEPFELMENILDWEGRKEAGEDVT